MVVEVFISLILQLDSLKTVLKLGENTKLPVFLLLLKNSVLLL